MKIGVFDSGIGGLSVLHQARRRFPGADYIYYADWAHVPYGEKDRATITGLVDGIIAFLLDRGAEAVVIACNTATSAAVAAMREKYPALPIIGMEPAVKKALDSFSGEKVLAAATPITVSGEKMHGLLEKVDKDHLVDLIALPELVRFAETGEFCSPQVLDYLRRALAGFRLERYAAFVLGCTHFNYFKDSLRAVLPARMRFVDGIEGTVNRLAACVDLRGATTGSGSVHYYDSGRLLAHPDKLAHIEACLRRLDDMEAVY